MYVYLDASRDASTDGEHASEATPDRTEELITTLREQLQAERAAHSEARRLLAAALERIPPAIESPGSPESGAEMPMGPTPSEASEAAQEPPERVPWWRRVFGG